MNAYYENTAYCRNGARVSTLPPRRYGDGFINFICAIISVLTCSAALKIEKTAISFGLFLAFFGIVGSIDSGSISMLGGILLCAVVSLLEYATLKSLVKRVK